MKLVKCLPRLEHCCCFFSIKTGAIIIGILETIYFSILLIFAILLITGVVKVSEDIDRGMADYIMNLLEHLVGTILAVLLLLGVLMNQSKFVLIWIFGTYIRIFLLFVSVIVLAVGTALNWISVGAFLAGLTLVVFNLAFSVYWVCVVGTYYNVSLDDDDE